MKSYIVLLTVALSGCAALADFAMDQVTGGSSKGGINTELVVGDKEQVLGNNIEVKADKVDKVVGESDNSVAAEGAEFVEVNNINYPTWLIVSLLILSFVFLCLPTPTNMYKAFKRWQYE